MSKKFYKDCPVSFAVLIACCVMTLLSYVSKAPLSSTEKSILYGAYYKPFIVCGQYYRLITSAFLHGSLMHLMMNMIALMSLGVLFEPMLGKVRYAILLFASVVGGNLFLMVATENTVAIGLSGGLYGLMASYIYTIIRHGGLSNPGIRKGLMKIILINLLISSLPGIAGVAHYGGMLVGFVMIISFDQSPAVKSFRKNTIIAGCMLLVALGVLVNQNKYVSMDQAFIGSDARYLNYQVEHGHEKRAMRLAKRLNDYYGKEIFKETI